MSRSRKTKEPAIHAYEHPSRLSRHACSAGSPREVLQWTIGMLDTEYGLTQPELHNPTGSLPDVFAWVTYTSRLGDPFLFVVVCARGDVPSAEAALRKLLLGQRIGSLGLATDGTEHVFLRRRHDAQRCDYLTDLERCDANGRAPGDDFPLAGSTADARQARPLQLSPRLEGMFFEAHSHIRDIDGMHPDEALDELCKALFLKLHEETQPNNAPNTYRLHRSRFQCAEDFAACLRRRYFDAVAHLVESEAEIFATPIRLSSAALCKVFETIQDYSLSDSDVDIKGRAFQRVLDPAMRAGMGQFFTPLPVIDFMVDCLQPQLHESVLDPFCGAGRFLSRALRYIHEANPQVGQDLSQYARNHLSGIEKSDRMVRIAKTDMLLAGDGHATVLKGDSLAPFENLPGFKPEQFDIVLTNPPFGSVLGSEALSQLGHFELTRGSASIPLEVLGVERSLQFLKPGGRIGIVLPEGIFSNARQQHVREWLARRVNVLALVSLPIATFAPFGANVKTTIMFARKRRPGEASDDYQVWLARVDSVGYDAAGRDTSANELPLVATELRTALHPLSLSGF